MTDTTTTSGKISADLQKRVAKAATAIPNLDLLALVDGINASPIPLDDDSWIGLLGNLDDDLAGQVSALRRERAGLTSPADLSPADKLARLRAELASAGVDGFIIPKADEHQGEYVPKRAERLSWLTGFDGSAGVAAVLTDKAAMLTDGRYTLQVREQVDQSLYTLRHMIEEPLNAWIAEELPEGGKLSYDPWLHTVNGLRQLKAVVEKKGGSLVPLTPNPIDTIWEDQPPAPISPVVPHGLEYSGKAHEDKRAEISAILKREGQGALFISQPDAIAWLLNIRGRDVPRTPLPLSFALLKDDATVDLFIEREKISVETRSHLGNQVSIRDRGELEGAVKALAATGTSIRYDAGEAPSWVEAVIGDAGGSSAHQASPIAIAKACKNEVELSGTQSAHVRDGAAITKFLKWFEENASSGTITEIDAADKLHAFRLEDELIRDLSFDTISGSGPNGAIVHYRVTEESNRRIEAGDLYLVDSGAQYLDGTTDITRTLAVGTPIAEARDRYTRVLQGHLALGAAVFPEGVTGSQLDSLARMPLWKAGLDFDHGTGHGVGSYLSVHEGPQRISKAPNTTALQPGMIVSNEPGYYKTGAYGIRIENLITVVHGEIDDGERAMLTFDTLTLAPYERALIDVSLLSGEEVTLVDAYHGRVRDTLSPLLDRETREWLAVKTAPLA